MAITAKTLLHLRHGDFTVRYHKTPDGECVSFSLGDIENNVPIVRIHSACLFGEAFFSFHCDCGQQLEKTLSLIKKHKAGVVIYKYDEGRGIGLENKIKSMGIENMNKCTTLDAFTFLGYEKHDYRDYKAEIEALKELNTFKKIQLVSNNPNKIAALKKADFEIIKYLPLKIKLNKYNRSEMLVKKEKLNYYYD